MNPEFLTEVEEAYNAGFGAEQREAVCKELRKMVAEGKLPPPQLPAPGPMPMPMQPK